MPIGNLKKILVINLGGIGDILLSTPALKALGDSFSETEVSILIVPRIREIVKHLNYIDEIFVFYKGYSLIGLFKNIFTLLALRSKRFDLLINMRSLVSKASAAKMKFMIKIINPKTKAGRDTDGRGDFFDFRVPENAQDQHYEMFYDIETVKAVGAEVIDKSIDFTIRQEVSEKITHLLQNKGILKSDLVIGLHPGAEPSRRWPVENFALLIKRLNQSLVCKFIITGSKDEIRLGAKLIKLSKAKNILNFAGEHNLLELAALIKRCNMYISNDTGPMHMAAILKTPLIAIFGPGRLTHFDPRNISEQAVIFYKRVDCAPCDKFSCRSMKCLKIISPDEVTEAALILLNQDHK